MEMYVKKKRMGGKRFERVEKMDGWKRSGKERVILKKSGKEWMNERRRERVNEKKESGKRMDEWKEKKKKV